MGSSGGGGGDYDYPQFMSQYKPKARKQHKCCECFGVIEKGETYVYTAGKWDDFFSFKTCTQCADLINIIQVEAKTGLAFGMLHEFIFDSDNFRIEYMTTYMNTRVIRGAKKSPNEWMEKQFIEAVK